MSKDTIYRQAAIDAVSYSIELCNKALDSITLVGKDRYAVEVERNSLLKLKDDIKLFPPAHPESKKGKWIYAEHDIAMCDGYRCDQCGFFVPWDYKYKFIDFIKDYHWCSFCGADMRGGENETD